MLVWQAGRRAGSAGALQRLVGAIWNLSKHNIGCSGCLHSSSTSGTAEQGPEPPLGAEIDALNKELDELFGMENADKLPAAPAGMHPGVPEPGRSAAAELSGNQVQLQRREHHRQDMLQHHQDAHDSGAHPSKEQLLLQQLQAMPVKVISAAVAPGQTTTSRLPPSHAYNRRVIDSGKADPDVTGPDAKPSRPSSSRPDTRRSSRGTRYNAGGSSDGSTSSGSSSNGSSEARLSHVDASGKAAMVDVANKQSSVRDALASCRVLLGPEAFAQVESNQVKKGDVLTVAQLAGVMAAKHTSTLIPLCHNIFLSKVDVRLRLDAPQHAVVITASARSVGPTGVEMEALTAAAVAALTVYDMCKAVTKDAVITELMLLRKSGGKSGNFQRVGAGLVPDEL